MWVPLFDDLIRWLPWMIDVIMYETEKISGYRMYQYVNEWIEAIFEW